MKWFRNWFGRQPADRSPSPGYLSRPCLEALEDRCVPSISRAFLGDGTVVTLVTFNNGSLVAVGPSFNSVVISTGVKNAHAFRDAQGQFGADIVLNNGLAFEFDSTGTHFLGSNVNEASTTFDRNGNFLTVVAQENGTVIFIQPLATTIVGTNFAGASTYLDINGGTGVYLNFKLGSGTFLTQTDSATPGALILGPGFKEAQANADPTTGQFFVALTTDNGNTFETTTAGTHFIGDLF
jgi:hypothetical protein